MAFDRKMRKPINVGNDQGGQGKVRDVYTRGGHVQTMTAQMNSHERDSHKSTVLEPRNKEKCSSKKHDHSGKLHQIRGGGHSGASALDAARAAGLTFASGLDLSCHQTKTYQKK